METRLECCLAFVNVQSLERLASVERRGLWVFLLDEDTSMHP